MTKKLRPKDKIQDGEPYLIVSKCGDGCDIESACRLEDLPVFGKYVLLHILNTLIEHNGKPELSLFEITGYTLSMIVKDVLIAMEEEHSISKQSYLN